MTIRYGARYEDLVGSGSGSTDAWALSLLATYETDPELGPAVLPRSLERVEGEIILRDSPRRPSASAPCPARSDRFGPRRYNARHEDTPNAR